MMPFAAFSAPDVQWVYLLPVLLVLGGGVIGVLVEAFVPASVRRLVQVFIALLATVASFVAIVLLWQRDAIHSEVGVPVVADSLRLTPFTLGLQGVIAVLTALALLTLADRTSTGEDAFAPVAAAVPGSAYEELARKKRLEQTEVFPLVLLATGGMMIMPAAGNLLVMFIALEMLSLPLYVLTAMARRRRLLSQEASLKYFLLGAFASALFLFGSALIYGFAGSVDLAQIADAEAANRGMGADGAAFLLVGIFLVFAGLLFKVGAVPFHMWSPDVYQGAPTPVTGYMAACTKVAAFGALLQVAWGFGGELTESNYDTLFTSLWIVSILTMIVGTVVAVAQEDMKRMLAYSSIAHAGFILVAIAAGPNDAQGATLFYLAAYGVATIGAFAVVSLVRERTARPQAVALTQELVAVGVAVSDAETMALVGSSPGRVAGGTGRMVAGGIGGGTGGGGSGSAGSADLVPDELVPDEAADIAADVVGEATHLSQWAGLGRRSPWLAGAFALFLLSMAGIPLTAGFIAKFSAFGVALNGGGLPLVIVGVIASTVALFFYARIIVLMFFMSPAEGEDAATVIGSRGPIAIAIGVCVLAVIALGVWPGPVLNLLS